MTTPETADPQISIPSARFTLRPLQAADAGLLTRYLGDERVAQMTRVIPHPLPPEYVSNLLERAQDPERKEDFWVIDGSEHGHAEVMGMMKMIRLDRNQSEIRMWVAPAFWNTGLASEAIDVLLAANPQGACDVYAEVFQDDARSARVLTNRGFAYLGDAETFSVARNGVAPTWTYARKMGSVAPQPGEIVTAKSA